MSPARRPLWNPPCTARSEALGEPAAGTAPPERRWLVIEQPGAWGHGALRESDLDLEIAEELAARAEARGMRLQLVRRRLGRETGAAGTVAMLACLEPGNRYLEEVPIAEQRALLDLDLDAFAAGTPTGAGRLLDRPRWLVCTHGTKDPCCSKRGLPVLAALRAVVGDHAWHSAHLGGDRFAANAAVLPLGLVLGRVPADAIPELVDDVDGGRLPLELLRGRAGQPKAAQVAELAVRRELALRAEADLSVLACDADGPVSVVTLAVAAETITVRAEHRPTERLRPVSCRAEEETDPGAWHVLDIARRPAAA